MISTPSLLSTDIYILAIWLKRNAHKNQQNMWKVKMLKFKKDFLTPRYQGQNQKNPF